MVNKGKRFNGSELRKPRVFLKFQSEEDELIKLRKSFVGVVINPRMAYNIRMSFEIEGYFSIKVTPFGANFRLLEESEIGKISDLIREAKSWWG